MRYTERISMKPNPLAARLLADRIVLLIERSTGKGQTKGIQEALELLKEFYAGDSEKVTLAYEAACRVVLKKLTESQPSFQATHEIVPGADWQVMQASRAVIDGNLHDAFLLLREAHQSGARLNLCQNVVFQILRELEKPDRVSELRYNEVEVVSIEVGRVKGGGFILIQNKRESKKLRASPKPKSDLEFDPDADREKIILHMRTEEEFNDDVLSGRLSISILGDSPITLDRIDWLGYFAELGKIAFAA